MKIMKNLGKAVKPFLNFPSWIGWNQIASDTKTIGKLAKELADVKPKGDKRVETFEQAVKRLNLTPEDLQKRKKAFLLSSLFYAAFSIILFAYGVYLLFWKVNFLAFLIALSVSVLAMAFAYREHFWYFQMSIGRLGCHFKEWVAFTLKGVKK